MANTHTNFLSEHIYSVPYSVEDRFAKIEYMASSKEYYYNHQTREYEYKYAHPSDRNRLPPPEPKKKPYCTVDSVQSEGSNSGWKKAVRRFLTLRFRNGDSLNGADTLPSSVSVDDLEELVSSVVAKERNRAIDESKNNLTMVATHMEIELKYHEFGPFLYCGYLFTKFNNTVIPLDRRIPANYPSVVNDHAVIQPVGFSQ